MKALILYVLLLVVGAAFTTYVGAYVEQHVSSTASLVVFLAMFFANFVVCWLAVIFIIDGSLKNARATQDQIDIETAARRSISKRG